MGDDEVTAGRAFVLRPWRVSDAAVIVASCADDDELRRWIRFAEPFDEDRARAWIDDQWRGGPMGPSLELAVEDAVDASLLGGIGLSSIDRRTGTADVGYWIAAGSRRRGLASEAVRVLTDWSRRELGLTQLRIVADVRNETSHMVARRAGFVENPSAGPEGHLVFTCPAPGVDAPGPTRRPISS